MKWRFAALLISTGLITMGIGSTPAGATIPPVLPFGPSYFGPGPLTCASMTYIITEHGFGADIQVVDSRTVLIFHAYGPVPPTNPPPGLKLIHCTGEIPDSLGNIDHFDLFVSIAPSG